MRFTVERDDILSALSFVAKYAETKDYIPILTQVLLRSDEGRIIVGATDLDRAAEDSFPAEVAEAGAICLPAELLLKSIKSASGSEVSVSSDGRQATVICGGSKFKLPVLLAADFPELKMLTGEAPYEFDLPAETLLKAHASVGFAKANSEIQYWLNGISWLVDGGQLEFCATDRHGLSLFSIPAPIPVMPNIIVPDFDIPVWDGTVSVAFSEHFIRFVNGNQALASKLVQGTFPAHYRAIIPDNKNIVRFDRAEMLSAIMRARLIAYTGKEHSILFAGKDGKIFVSAITDRGETSDSVAFEGDDFRIAIASGVIAPILQSFDCEVVEWHVADHATATTIHDPNDQNRITAAMPYHDYRVLQGASEEQEAA